ncbi:MAG: ABC transporter permease [Chitinophagaceae bacterium]|nr:MAG: ABC transporter permease [Chitinophagaceae bacterium]
MLKSYLKTAFRNLSRNKVYSLINISGLSIGLACAMLIMLYIKDEVSYDRFHKNVSQIYRVVSKTSIPGDSTINMNPYTGYLQGPRFSAAIPEISAFVRLQHERMDLRNGTEVNSQEIFYTDSSFFSVFSFPLIKGDRMQALKNPNSAVISEEMSIKQFGTTDAIGKTLLFKDGETFSAYLVTGIASKQPENSSVKFDVLLPIRVSKEDETEDMNWLNSFMNTFVVLKDGTDARKTEAKMQQVFNEDAREAMAMALEKFGFKDKITQMLQPFTDMHLSTDLQADNGLVGSSNPMFSYILSGIAIFILLIACINFINLTVARSVKRAKEIGIRKVIGGDRKQLMFQFLGESFVLSMAAFLLSIILVQLVLPIFNELANKKLALAYLADGWLIAGYFLLFITTSLMAGFYPAIVLSAYQPVRTLYSRFTLSGKNYLQKSLVVLQFSLASFLIIGTMVIYSQLNYLTNTNLGYDYNNLVVVTNRGMSLNDANTFRSELLHHKNIVEVAPKNNGMWTTIAKINGETEINFAFETIDEKYFPLMKIPIVKGRNFSNDFTADSIKSIVVNESFVKAAGWKEPIGQEVNFWYDNRKVKVVGVVKDHHYEALNTKIKPQMFRVNSGKNYGKLLMRIQPGTETATLKFIEGLFKKLYPLNPFSYTFMEEQNRKKYESEDKWKQIILFSAILTIFISCIGLFGLSVLSAEKRVKEIGIRKVLGASVQQVVRILSADFLKLVILALALAIPAAWIASNQWLQNYPYRTSLSWKLFISGAVLVIAVAFFTISFQAIKAAVSNPINSLKAE